ncbi:MAG TPA: hypothetical protein VK125_07140 [Bacillota bacterium]|nr:hypothetical protein [Bacillota bacterium]
MRDVLEIVQKEEIRREKEKILLEIDYELARLYDFMQVDDEVQMAKTKGRLETLRRKFLICTDQLHE